MKNDLHKKLKEEDERHGQEVAKAIDEFEEKALPEQDGEEEKAHRAKAIDEFKSALHDEHEEHLDKCMKAIDDHYELEDQKKSIDEFKSEMKAEHLKHVKAIDKAHDELKKDWPDGDPKEDDTRKKCEKAIEEFTKAAGEELDRHEKAHSDMAKDHMGEADDDEEEKAMTDLIVKAGRAISAKNKEKLKAILEKMESHHNDVTAAIKELMGSEDGDEGEEHKPDEKGGAPNSRSSTSGAAHKASHSEELEAYLFSQRLVRQIKTASENGLRQLNERLAKMRK